MVEINAGYSDKLFDNHSQSQYLEFFDDFISRLKVRKPKELVFINPQLIPEEYFDTTTARRKGYYAYPPTGPLYLCAAASESCPELKFKVIDLNYQLLKDAHTDSFNFDNWKTHVFDALSNCEAPFVAITYMFGTTKPNFLSICQYLRAEFPEVPIICGGVQATYDYRDILESGLCDIVLRKEGEAQLKTILDACYADKPEALPSGACILLDGQVLEFGETAEYIANEWDRDITPYWSLLEVEKYHRYGSLGAFSRFVGLDKPFSTVLTNRGCRARCTFCTVRDFNGFGIRQRTIESVVNEVKFLVREKGIKQIDWIDDDLLWNEERALKLFKALANELPELEWTSSNGLIAVAISDEMLDWMVKSGLRAFNIGIETGNEEMLKKVKKPTTKKRLLEKRDLFKKYPEVFVSPNFIIGFPGETFQQMLDTFNYAMELGWDWSSFFICQPLRGTEMFSAFKELGDSRCDDENYSKTLNPGRSTRTGEISRCSEPDEPVLAGMDVFKLDPAAIPGQEQLKEIWFAFNFLVNFVNNINFNSDGNPGKILKWLESIAMGYPHDASMCAALVKASRLCGKTSKANHYSARFIEIVSSSSYWQMRIDQYPQLEDMADVLIDRSVLSGAGSIKYSMSRDAMPEFLDG